VRALSRLIRGDLSPASRRIEDDAQAPLRGTALRRKMAGATLLYSTVYGDPATLEVRANGELAGSAGYAGEDCDQGRWWVDGDHWYRQWQRWAYAEVTGFRIVIDGDQLRWYADDGLLADTAIILRKPRRPTTTR
jgi:GntR family transcriptional regulator/MocR family aminotransferase